MRITLQLHSPFGASLEPRRHALIWSYEETDGVLWLEPITPDQPAAVLNAAIQQLQNELAVRLKMTSRKTQVLIQRASWRLVLPRGFYHHTRRGPGPWNQTKRTACASDIEDVCPVPLEQLAASSLVLDEQQAWVVGILREELDPWLAAAGEHKIVWEGIWTTAGALIEGILEQEGLDRVQEYQWQADHLFVSINPGDAPEKQSSITVRVIADPESHSSRLLQELADQELAARFPDVPPALYPGVLAHELKQIDVSESLNLAVEQEQARHQTPPRHRPLIRALYAASLAAVLLSGAFQLRRLLEERVTSRLAQEIRSVWQSAQMNTPLAVSPVSTLEQQANIWTNIRAQQTLGLDHPKIQSQWMALASSIPPDVKLQVTSLRIRGGEITIEGQTLNQADARKLETAWGKLPGMAWEPMRLSTASSGFVGFSLRGGLK